MNNGKLNIWTESTVETVKYLVSNARNSSCGTIMWNVGKNGYNKTGGYYNVCKIYFH